MTHSAIPLRDTAFMDAFLDLVIPASVDGTMPGAGSLGLSGAVAASVEADETLGRIVGSGLRAVCDAALARNPGGLSGLPPAARLEVVQEALGRHPMLMTGLARHLYPAYYQHPRVLEALGEPPRPPFPEGFEIEPTDTGLLAKLHARRDAAASP
jgi:hypothetical protein